MDPVLTTVLSWAQTIFASIVGVVVGALVTKLRKRNADVKKIEEQQKAANDALLCLVRSEIRKMHTDHVHNGVPFDLEAVHAANELHTAYKTLGGNGDEEKIYNELMAVPVCTVMEVHDDTA